MLWIIHVFWFLFFSSVEGYSILSTVRAIFVEGAQCSLQSIALPWSYPSTLSPNKV